METAKVGIGEKGNLTGKLPESERKAERYLSAFFFA